MVNGFATTTNEPTHADALQASRSVMKQALLEIAWFSASWDDTVKIAEKALADECEAYKLGVYRAVD